MVDQFCQPIYEEWLADAITLGRIELFPGGWDDPYVRRAMTRCIWTGSSAGSLDPQKEVAAADQKVKCGFSTIERESMELNGSDWRDNVRQQATEKRGFEEADLTFPPDRTAGGFGGMPRPSPSRGQPAAKASNRKTKPGRRAVELASGTSGRFER
jgi:capsid protein